MDKPLICTFNLKNEINEKLEASGFNIYRGSVGKQIETVNKGYFNYRLCLLNSDFPINIQEYKVFIIDLTDDETIPYVESDHVRSANKSDNNVYFLSSHPQTIFDPRPYSLSILQTLLDLSDDCLIIVFSAEAEDVKYDLVKKTSNSYEPVTSDIHSNYSFLSNISLSKNKTGFETEISIESGKEISSFLEKYIPGSSYHVTFNHPEVYKDNKRIKDPNFIPLINNKSKEIVSFFQLQNEAGLFFFPDINRKGEFLIEFLQEIAPSGFPDIFPESEKNKWINEDRYYLPKYAELLNQKKDLELEYERKIREKDSEIDSNNKQYSFLHNILTKTDAELVTAVITFLEWLGFENVRDMDQQDSSKDEDIQIETAKGLLIIEVKGLGGTSKDADCSQIGKHKHRRSKERNKFDVFALYIVNHRRHLPPHLRQNPPFTTHQISDALHDERGLLTTWEMFNLYFNIEKGIISKEEAKSRFYDFGLINFYKSLKSIGKPKEVLKKGEVAIIDINEAVVNVDQAIYIKDEDEFEPAKILSIQLNDTNVQSAANSEVGIKISKVISKKSEIFIK